METLRPEDDIPEKPVGLTLTHQGRSIALVDLGREASEALRESWPADQPFQSGGVVDSTWLLPMLGAGGAAAASLMAGNVFLATANPATLMTIGAGVGSAVIGPTGIVAQAPFIAASNALMPVVAPVMLFATVSSVMMCALADAATELCPAPPGVPRHRSHDDNCSCLFGKYDLHFTSTHTRVPLDPLRCHPVRTPTPAGDIPWPVPSISRRC